MGVTGRVLCVVAKDTSQPGLGEVCACMPIVFRANASPIDADFLEKPNVPCVGSRNLADEEKAFCFIFLDGEIAHVVGEESDAVQKGRALGMTPGCT